MASFRRDIHAPSSRLVEREYVDLVRPPALGWDPARGQTFDPGIAVRNAWAKHLEEVKLTPQEREEFQRNGDAGSIEDRLAAISQSYEAQNRRSKALKASNALQPLAATVKMYMPAALQAGQAQSNPVLLILGGVMCALQVQTNFQDHVNQVTNRLAQMSRKLSFVQRVTTQIFEQDSELQLALTELYGIILQYCCRVHRVLVHKSGKDRGKLWQFFVSTVKPANDQDADLDSRFNVYYERFFQLVQTYDRDQHQAHYRRTKETQTMVRSLNAAQDELFMLVESSVTSNQAIKNQLGVKDRLDRIEMLIERKHDISCWIRRIDYQVVYDGLCESRVDGTCQWFLEHDKYVAWREASEGCFLALTGEEGFGKTYLAAAAIDDLEFAKDGNTAVAYHFFRRGEPMTGQLDYLMGSLVHQLLRQTPGISGSVEDMYFTNNQSASTLFSATCGQLEKLQTVYLVLDGLDECPEQKKLVDLLVNLTIAAAGKNLVLKILSFNREGYVNLEKLLHIATFHIKMDLDTNKEDIQRYISHKVTFDSLKNTFGSNEEKRNTPENNQTLEHAQTKLLDNAEGKFVYVSLMTSALEKARNPTALDNALSNLPKDLVNFYARVLDEMDKTLDRETRVLVHNIILYTYWSMQPLSPADMLTALAIEPGMTHLNTRDVGGSLSDAPELCRNLVKLNAEGRFELCHGSFRDFLDVSVDRHWEVSFRLPHNSAASNIPRDLRSLDGLAPLCLTFLCLDNFQDSGYSRFSELVNSAPLLEYAAKFWSEHVRQVDRMLVQDQVLRLSESAAARNMCMSPYRKDDETITPPWAVALTTPLHLIVASGLDDFIDLVYQTKHLTARDPLGRAPCDYACGYGRQTTCLKLIRLAIKEALDFESLTSRVYFLQHSAEQGWEDIINEFIANNADIDTATEESNRTPLICAAGKGHKEIVVKLLEAGADASYADKNGVTAFLAAVEGEHHQLWDLFSQRDDFNVNVTQKDGARAVQLAAANDDVKGFEWLLERKANLTSGAQTSANQDAVHAAAGMNSDKIIAALHSAGMSLTKRTAGGWDPVQQAAHHGSLNALKVLLRYEEVSVGAVDKFGSTAFHKAAAGGYADILELLHSVDATKTLLSQPNNRNATPLHLAAEAGHLRAVTWLLDNLGSNMNLDLQTNEPDCQSPLLEAMNGRHIDVASLLIQRNSNVNIRGYRNISPLHCAAHKGLLSLIDLVMKAGGEIGALDGYGRTALHWACDGGSQDVAISLCKDYIGLDIEVSDDDMQTGLHLAASHGFTKAVDFLVNERKAKSTKDSLGNYPIHYAAQNGHAEVVQILIDYDTNSLDQENQTHETPLMLAAYSGHADIVKLLAPRADINRQSSGGLLLLTETINRQHLQIAHILLDLGVDIHRQNADGSTPLYYAVGVGAMDIVEKMLELHCDASIADRNGIWPLAIALAGGDANMAFRLLKERQTDLKRVDNFSTSALHFAASSGDDFVVKLVLALYPDCAAMLDDVGDSALTHAAMSGSVDVITQLIQAGVPAHNPGPYARSLLSCAAESCHPKAVDLLLTLDQSTEINRIFDVEGSTALIGAARAGGIRCVELLLQAGADPYMVNVFGLCAYDYAIKYPSMRKVFAKYCPPHSPLDCETRELHLRQSVVRAIDMLIKDGLGSTTLSFYAYLHHLQVISNCLTMLQESASEDDKLTCLAALIYRSPANRFSSDIICSVCGYTIDAADFYQCNSCAEEICVDCSEDFANSDVDARKTHRQMESLEQDVWPVVEALRNMSFKQAHSAVKILRVHGFFLGWLRVQTDESNEWKNSSSMSEKYLAYKMPGITLLSLLQEMVNTEPSTNGTTSDVSDDKPDDLSKRYNDWKVRSKLREPACFGCDDHTFRRFKADDIRAVQADREKLDDRVRLRSKWLSELRQRIQPKGYERPSSQTRPIVRCSVPGHSGFALEPSEIESRKALAWIHGDPNDATSEILRWSFEVPDDSEPEASPKREPSPTIRETTSEGDSSADGASMLSSTYSSPATKFSKYAIAVFANENEAEKAEAIALAGRISDAISPLLSEAVFEAFGFEGYHLGDVDELDSDAGQHETHVNDGVFGSLWVSFKWPWKRWTAEEVWINLYM